MKVSHIAPVHEHMEVISQHVTHEEETFKGGLSPRQPPQSFATTHTLWEIQLKPLPTRDSAELTEQLDDDLHEPKYRRTYGDSLARPWITARSARRRFRIRPSHPVSLGR